MLTLRFPVVIAALAWALTPALAAPPELTWRPWSADVFATAKAENRFVILDLEAVWCHWCHVMEQTTYRDTKVAELLGSKFVTVRADQDANPDLSSRYGNWGWPATIILAADGTEIVKRRGYIAPEQMASLLQAIIDDPSPGPSVMQETDIVPGESPLLSSERRGELVARSREAFDTEHAGWGDVHKFIDPDSMDWDLLLAERGDAAAADRARRTLDAALKLIDPEQGGIYQYSDAVDWTSPHYEKIMWYQANGLRQYSAAYALWKEPKYLHAAEDIARYLLRNLHADSGAFFTSQDADVDESMPGKSFYALTKAAREALPRQPRIDRNIYARENGWAVSGLAAYYAATGNAEALSAAEASARWIVANRRTEAGVFRHGDSDRDGPFLGDALAMGQAALDLYAAAGDRAWLGIAAKAGDVIAATFKDAGGGFRTTAQREAGVGVFLKPAKNIDEQVAVARFANRLYRYSGNDAYHLLAEHGGRYLTSDSVLDAPNALPGVLLADAELGHEPIHMTVVGHRDDQRATSLHAAGLAFPAIYKRLDWWDKREGPLPNPDVQYPELDQPAAFACTNRICSLPVFEPADLPDTVNRMLASVPGSGSQ